MAQRNARLNVGLVRALSKLGYCSRSQAYTLIQEGRVKLNGHIQRDPEAPVRMEKDLIAVDGKPVEAATRLYLMMNKPRGIVTTASDEKGRATVLDLLPGGLPFLGPVGRLDKASEGLLLFTNDSEWAARVTAPETHLDKIYHVQISARPIGDMLQKLTRGVNSGDELLAAKSVRRLREGQRNAWLEIVLDEGRNRQIRRMFEKFEVEVLRLIRIAIGPVQLGNLPKGAVRPLEEAEKLAIDAAITDVSSQISR